MNLSRIKYEFVASCLIGSITCTDVYFKIVVYQYIVRGKPIQITIITRHKLWHNI